MCELPPKVFRFTLVVIKWLKQRCSLPMTGSPVVELNSKTVIPAELDGLLRDSCNNRIDVALHKNVEASSVTFYASTVDLLILWA